MTDDRKIGTEFAGDHLIRYEIPFMPKIIYENAQVGIQDVNDGRWMWLNLTMMDAVKLRNIFAEIANAYDRARGLMDFDMVGDILMYDPDARARRICANWKHGSAYVQFRPYSDRPDVEGNPTLVLVDRDRVSKYWITPEERDAKDWYVETPNMASR